MEIPTIKQNEPFYNHNDNFPLGFLQPSGNIYPVLADAINPKAYDLSNLVRGRVGDKEGQTMIQELQYIVENLVYHITEIMVGGV